MWFIISSDNPDHKYIVFGGNNLSIGRKDCDILVTGDATVSRRHAELAMSHTEGNVANTSKLPVLLLKDLSKFGTWVNSQRVQGERVLKDGDTVYFGSPKSTFMVVSEPLVVTTSCLENASKKSLRQLLCTLGGHMVNEWTRNCGLLIMSKISVTIKVICAMVSLKPVVTPAYLEAYLKYLQGSRDKPEPELFTPDVAESQLDPTEVTFAIDHQRKTLFQGKTFVFLSQKQFKKMSMAIELAGGTPLLMDTPGEVDILTEPSTVVMSCADQEASQKEAGWISRVEKILEKVGKHLIADAELGYAVLYASTEKHCNPDYVAETSLCRLPSQTMSQTDMFAPDTATQNRTPANKDTQKRKSVAAEGSKSQVQDATLTQYTGQRLRTQDDSMTVSNEKSQRSKLKQTSPPKHDVEVRVKKEVPSQTSTPQSSRKRSRKAVEVEDSEEEKYTSKRIKPEPVTPSNKTAPVKQGSKPQQPKTTDVVEPEWDSDDGLDYSKIEIDESIIVPQRRTSPRHSPKPSPRTSPSRSEKEDKKRKSRSRSPSEPAKKVKAKPEKPNYTLIDDDDDDECYRSSKRSGENRSRSKSPSEPSKKVKEKKPEKQSYTVIDDDDDDDDDECYRSSKRSRKTKSRSKSPSESAKKVKVKTENYTVIDDDDDDDDECYRSSKRSKTRSRSKSPSEQTKNVKVKKETQNCTVIDDDDDDECHRSSKRAKKTRSRSKSPSDRTKQVKVKSETQSFTIMDEVEEFEGSSSRSKKTRAEVLESDQSGPERKSKSSKTSRMTEDNSDRERAAVASDNDATEQAERARPPRDNHTVPAGFMTAIKSEHDEGDTRSIKTEMDEELPRNCIQVETCSLVVRREKPVEHGSGDCPDGYTRWKGKIIRNFKKFRKTEHCGANKLPKIIGGSDLEVHAGQRSKEMDDWMKESIQVESQHTREDEQAQAMFDYNPKAKKRGR